MVFASLLLLQGCGGGGSAVSGGSGDGGGSDGGSRDNGVQFKYSRISIAGSSITHGNVEYQGEDAPGYLGEKSYVGYVERYFRENIADTIGPNELAQADDTIDEPMSYLGKIKVYNQGTEISGSLKASDEIAIVYASSDQTTKVRMEVDGQSYDYTIPAGDYLPVKKSFDDSNTDFYKAFRENNPKAVKIWKVQNQPHTFKLTVLQGALHLNFITNHMYWFQNAGVGGFEAADFLRKTENGTYANSTVKDIIAFDPDLFIFESGTNDAKTWAKELALKSNPDLDAPSTNRWIVEDPVGFTANGKSIRLTRNVTVSKGDVVIMGDYQGDIRNLAVGIVSSNSSGRDISLEKVVSYAGQLSREVNGVPADIARVCRIKSISVWENRVERVVQAVENGVGHAVVTGIGTSGVPNYYDPAKGEPYTTGAYTPRRLLGYREKGQMLAQKHGWFFVDFFNRVLAVEPGVDYQHKWTYGDNTHPNVPGREYFGQAIINALTAN